MAETMIDEIAGAVVEGTLLVYALEAGNISPDERQHLLAGASGSIRLVQFSAYSEPRSTLIAGIRRISREMPAFPRVVKTALYNDRLGMEATGLLLEIVASAGTEFSERIAFDLVDHSKVNSLFGADRDHAQVSLVWLASKGGPESALALISRMRENGAAGFLAASAVLRTIASQEPSLLALGLTDLRAELEAGGSREERVELIADVGRRSTPVHILRAFASLIPSEYPNTISAIFGGNRPLYSFVRRPGLEDRLDICWSTDDSSDRIAMTAVSSDPTWHLDICEIASVRPRYDLWGRRGLGEAETDRSPPGTRPGPTNVGTSILRRAAESLASQHE